MSTENYNNELDLQKTDISLRLNEENIQLLLDSTAEGIYAVDMDGNCTFCNKSALKLLGYANEDELLGKNMHWMVHYNRPDGTIMPVEECRIYKAISGGPGMHIEDEVLWRADGTSFPSSCYSYPQYKNGEIVGAVITFTDNTERIKTRNKIINANIELEQINEQLQKKQYSLEEQNTLIEELNSQLEDENTRYLQQKETLQAIVDSLGAGVMMVNQEHKVLFINDAWREFFSYLDIEDSLNPDDDFYVNSKASQNTDEFIRNMLTGMVNGREISEKLINLLNDDISRYSVDIEQTYPIKRYVNIYSNPCISHSKHGYGRVFVIRDISKQKEVDRLKLELISTVSHEMRTPMSSILGFSELLLTRKLPEERNREYLSVMNAEARRLTDLINDFLDIQRMESGRLAFDKQYNSIGQIIEEAVKLFETEASRHNVVYDKNADCEYSVSCDRDKILQVLSNLLSNAIKYSPDGGEIRLKLCEDKGRVIVSISDHGLGIPEGAKDKLFTKFFRVDNDDRRKIGGTGLGLAICREIVKLHGGEIWVESVYGQGSTFYFSLPLGTGGIERLGLTDDANRPQESKGRYGRLNYRMTVKGGEGLSETIKDILCSGELGVSNVEQSGNILIITLDGEEGREK